MGRVHNVGRTSVRRGRVAKIEGLDVYINQMFRADEDGFKRYNSSLEMRNDQAGMVTDIKTVFPEVVHDMIEDGRDAVFEIGTAFEELGEEIIEATPWHEEGPTDPPFHAAEAWKFGFYPNKKDGFTMTFYNPKDYMPFLEAGWSPQAPAGWIDALWQSFLMRIRS